MTSREILNRILLSHLNKSQRSLREAKEMEKEIQFSLETAQSQIKYLEDEVQALESALSNLEKTNVPS